MSYLRRSFFDYRNVMVFGQYLQCVFLLLSTLTVYLLVLKADTTGLSYVIYVFHVLARLREREALIILLSTNFSILDPLENGPDLES